MSTPGRFEGPKKPTVKNPIVGRIAFWTDDETSKVNYNTASHGTYWDTPRADTESWERLNEAPIPGSGATDVYVDGRAARGAGYYRISAVTP